MQKIISLFQRNYDTDKLVRNEITPGAEWVIDGEGIATRKWDGTCCMVRAGKLYKRYDAKAGKQPPEGFEPAQEPDPITKHWPGWLPVGDGPEDRWHREAWNWLTHENELTLADGTYELVGPKVQGNPEKFPKHDLLCHQAAVPVPDCPRDFERLKEFLRDAPLEGIVWHHPDGRMVKIKKRDFGFKR